MTLLAMSIIQNALRVSMVRTAWRSASARTMHHVTSSLACAAVLQGGRDLSVI